MILIPSFCNYKKSRGALSDDAQSQFYERSNSDASTTTSFHRISRNQRHWQQKTKNHQLFFAAATTFIALSLVFAQTAFADYVFGKYSTRILNKSTPILKIVAVKFPEEFDQQQQDDSNSDLMIQHRKRSASEVKYLPGHEHVCGTVIRTDFRPKVGQTHNGTLIEIQQDEQGQFQATFVECENTKRDSCHGINNFLFTSECVTLYEFRPARIRLEGSSNDEPFVNGFVKVPITCQCRLRRKVGNEIV